MNKKLFALMALMVAVAMFSACGSQDVPDDPPAGPDYSGYTSLDNGSNNNKDGAVSLGAGLFQGPVNFKGSLDNIIRPGENETVLVLDEDYYKLQLRRADIISITASNVSNTSSPFSFRFFGPCNRPNSSSSHCADTTINVKNITNSLEETISLGHIEPNGNADAPSDFYIRVFNSENNYPPSIPYAITVKLLHRDAI
jgi:hypothetical protein